MEQTDKPIDPNLSTSSKAPLTSADKKKQNCCIAVGVIVFFGYVVSLLLFCLFFIGQLHYSDPRGDFKAVCVGRQPSQDFCFLAVGQSAIGLISIAQTAIGLVTISQVGASLLAGIGQCQITLGVAIAQLAIGTFIPMCELGLASMRVIYAQWGFQLQLYKKKKNELFVSCCKRK